MSLTRNVRTSIAAVIVCAVVAPAWAATIDVTVRNFEFDPAVVQAAPGDTVRWTWESGNHTVTSGTCGNPDGTFDEPINSGATQFSWVVSGSAGTTVDYYCRPHCGGGMVAEIQIMNPIPTVSEWGLIGLGVLLVGAAVYVLRRRVQPAM